MMMPQLKKTIFKCYDYTNHLAPTLTKLFYYYLIDYDDDLALENKH
jgi:hypothetical protein